MRKKQVTSKESQRNPARKKVAAYCRVSTNYKKQEGSFELQQNYYYELIHSKLDWEFAGVYADYAKTGTQLKGRAGFQKMLNDCRKGKIDKIICKSISRFARNTIDLLESTKIIKECGATVFFEKEDIDTQWQYDELLLTVYAAMAQEESRNTSENIRWAYQKRFMSGIPAIQPIYGYTREKGSVHTVGNDIITIQNEANVIRMIFTYADNGCGYTEIARLLNRKEIPYKSGKAEWTMERIKRILHNERYAGNVICQKYYTYDYLTHKKRENKGEKQQYRIDGYHPAIIEYELFRRVQERFLLHKKYTDKKKKTKYPLSSKLVCGNCGTNYQTYNRKKAAKWRCGRAIRKLGLCEAPPINETEVGDAVKLAFMERFFLYDVSNMRYLKNSLNNMATIESIERDWSFLTNKIKGHENKLIQIHLDSKMGQINVNDPKTEEAISSISSSLEKLYSQLDYVETYKKIIENDTGDREGICQWLNSLTPDRKGREQFLDQIVSGYMHTWIRHIYVCAPGHFRFYWFDNIVTDVQMKGGV